jgi:peroxiredoxin
VKRTLVAGLVLLAGCVTPSASTGPASAAGGKVPDFELISVEGDRVRLSDAVGKGVVVLSFWDTWCEPCKAELPQLEKVYGRNKAKGLMLFGIAMDDATTVANVAPFVRRNGFSFPVLLDTSGTAANLYNPNKSAPYTVVIDQKGAIVHERAGYEPGEEVALEQKIVALLGAETPKP